MCSYSPLCASVVMRGLVELDAKCGGGRLTRGVSLSHNSEVVCSSRLVFPELHVAIRVLQDVCLPTPHGLGTLVGHCRLQSKVYIVQADATNPDNCMYVGGRRGFAPSRLQLTNSASYSRLDDDTGAAGAGSASAGVVAAVRGWPVCVGQTRHCVCTRLWWASLSVAWQHLNRSRVRLVNVVVPVVGNDGHD